MLAVCPKFWQPQLTQLQRKIWQHDLNVTAVNLSELLLSWVESTWCISVSVTCKWPLLGGEACWHHFLWVTRGDEKQEAGPMYPVLHLSFSTEYEENPTALTDCRTNPVWYYSYRQQGGEHHGAWHPSAESSSSEFSVLLTIVTRGKEEVVLKPGSSFCAQNKSTKMMKMKTTLAAYKFKASGRLHLSNCSWGQATQSELGLLFLCHFFFFLTSLLCLF